MPKLLSARKLAKTEVHVVITVHKQFKCLCIPGAHYWVQQIVQIASMEWISDESAEWTEIIDLTFSEYFKLFFHIFNKYLSTHYV